jgi:hypothetical protein
MTRCSLFYRLEPIQPWHSYNAVLSSISTGVLSLRGSHLIRLRSGATVLSFTTTALMRSGSLNLLGSFLCIGVLCLRNCTHRWRFSQSPRFVRVPRGSRASRLHSVSSALIKDGSLRDGGSFWLLGSLKIFDCTPRRRFSRIPRFIQARWFSQVFRLHSPSTVLSNTSVRSDDTGFSDISTALMIFGVLRYDGSFE